jgi:hypothetical protein
MLGLLSNLFPDLSKYSDEEYEKLVWQAKVRRGDAIWVVPLGVGLLAGGLWILAAVIMQLGIQRMGPTVGPPPMLGWGVINGIVALSIAVAAAGTTRWVLIVRSIRRLVNKAGCPYCEFSLVGLRVQSGWVRCPECGQRVALHEHRLTEDDLIPEGGWYRPIDGAGPRGAYQPPGVPEVRTGPNGRARRSDRAGR